MNDEGWMKVMVVMMMVVMLWNSWFYADWGVLVTE